MDDPLLLSRIQFALNISFHILFPTINIALAWLVVFFRQRYHRTNDEGWLSAYRFYTKVFALTFAMGVVSGVTMSFQFGTNWPGFMEKAGNVAGPLLGYEVLTAFFLEAGFLGIMLFGRERVSRKVHTAASVIVAAGTTLSAFWILSLNSWMQTPQGYTLSADGIVHVASWFEIVFNPSFPYRLAHMLLASTLTTAFLVTGLAAWQLLKGKGNEATPKVLKTGLILAAIAIPLQIFAGDAHGLNTLKHQPAKIAAMEGVWHTEKGAPVLLFALPNEQEQRNDYAIGIPKGASLILTHDLNGEIKGLNEFADKPPVIPMFWGFRIMVGMGMLMLLVSWYGVYRLRQNRFQVEGLPKHLLQVLSAMTFSGWVATLAGWYVTEIGRQPFLVYGVLRTEDAVTQVQPAGNILISLALYSVFTLVLLGAYVTVLKHMAEHADH
ncbi:MAG: cytochrome ubiquinol oxidase subunit I [Neisseria sp.]|nr:cytochrome ubiquinol oxidase subunit I [Neisseria sp.]